MTDAAQPSPLLAVKVEDQRDQHWALWAQVLARSSADIACRTVLDTLTHTWENLLTELAADGIGSKLPTAAEIPQFDVRSRAMLGGLAWT